MLGLGASTANPSPLISPTIGACDWLPGARLVEFSWRSTRTSTTPRNLDSQRSRSRRQRQQQQKSQLQLLRQPLSNSETRFSSPTSTAAASTASDSVLVVAAIPRQRGRLGGGRADPVSPTDPQSSRARPSPSASASLDAPAALDAAPAGAVRSPPSPPRLPEPSLQQPGKSSSSAAAAAAATTEPYLAAASSSSKRPDNHHHHHHHHHHHTDLSFRHSPFRTRGGNSSSRRRRLSAARLWNPTNSTPRPHLSQPSRQRRTSTPPPPAVPLRHPTLDRRDNTDPSGIGSGSGDYPLLTLPEQRQTRHSASTRASIQIESRASTDQRISLPRSVSIRASHDEKRPHTLTPRAAADTEEAGPSTRPLQEGTFVDFPRKLDKGKGKAVMAPSEDTAQRRSYSRDLERGPDIMDPRISNVSEGGIGSALSSSNSSIMGEDVEPDAGGEWGPLHPCYPHLNPHVPMDSAEYLTTRIIRIRRDWLLEGDLAPTFSNLYPEILDPAGLSEQEFRRIIDKINRELIPAFNPFSFRNILDSVIGLATGWLWDDFGMTGLKSRLRNLEAWIDKWNIEMEKTMASDDGTLAPKLVPLRRTGYMTLDIQIPDPEVARAPSTSAGGSLTALPLEPGPALTMLS